MAHRLRFSIAQPITIVGFTVSSGLLIADIIALTISHSYRLPSNSPASAAARHALTSAFYYAIMAAGIYLIIALLMCLTVYGAWKGHYARQFSLTAAQRTLMLQTMSFFTYLLLGALVFSHVEKWEYLDAVYWADVTLLTVGLGDYSYVILCCYDLRQVKANA
jgi:potassium channel subfamily K